MSRVFVCVTHITMMAFESKYRDERSTCEHAQTDRQTDVQTNKHAIYSLPNESHDGVMMIGYPIKEKEKCFLFLFTRKSEIYIWTEESSRGTGRRDLGRTGRRQCNLFHVVSKRKKILAKINNNNFYKLVWLAIGVYLLATTWHGRTETNDCLWSSIKN